MKLYTKIVILIFICFVVQSCSHNYKTQIDFAQEKYNSGDYEDAIPYCINSLEQNPNDIESMDLLEVSYDKTIEKKARIIKDLKKRKEAFYWDDVYNDYYQIIKLNEMLLHLTFNLRDFLKSKIIAIDDEAYIKIEEAINQAAEQHYIEGLKFSKLPDDESQKEAAKHFSHTLHYIPDYKNAQDLYNKCKSKEVK